MIFYDRSDQEIDKKEWIKEFECYYFLGGLTYGHRVNIGNQGSKFIEEKIEQILHRGLQINDLPLVIAWKIGAINHPASEYQQNIIYKNQFDQNFQLKTHFGLMNAGNIINYCQNNFEELLANDNAENVFNELYNNRGKGNRFGIVYCLALLYFFTQGKWPIYDKYAHIALDAILSNRQPGELIRYNQINDWQDYYEKYVKKIKNIFGAQNIPRNLDRSLWVYGHFFKVN